MGGGSAGIVPFANGGIRLPISGYPGEPANGIHQIAGGLAAVTERPASRTPPGRPKNKSAPFRFFPFASIWSD
jgi:hypothetical protein